MSMAIPLPIVLNFLMSTNEEISKQLALQFEQLQSVVFARMVQKVGDRRYWEQWAKDVAVIAERQIERIKFLISQRQDQREAFDQFLKGLQENINPSINEEQAVDMLAQHIITKPIFEALFEGYSFVKSNAISAAMQNMLDALEGETLPEESENLQRFYESVKKRAEGIDNADGKQRIIIELYDKFFKTAFPKMVQQLGIVYTPVEVVDFIIHSIDHVLSQEFNRSISDENIHILDPFTGTGTFMTRLLQSGLIDGKDLARKYKHELHANEIVLLAYYIAAVNIENAYHDQVRNTNGYQPFEGIVLTDTFQLRETDASETLISEMFPQNSERVVRQKKAPLRVIMGNPPYSVGQKSANDNAQNQKYDRLNARIAATYAKASTATNKNSLYDSYIKAFRWSTDRLDHENGGVIAFVSNGAWLDGNAQDGFRKTIEQEFSSIWVFNLRGNQRTSGELSRREGGKIFGSGSRAPIAITLLVKNPASKRRKALIHYHDIGDYLSREEKLNSIQKFKYIASPEMKWMTLKPDINGDWLNQRTGMFDSFIPIGDKSDKNNRSTYFLPLYSNGLKTQRDAWCYNSSEEELRQNIQRHLNFYEEQRLAFVKTSKHNPELNVSSFLARDNKSISWTRALQWDIEKNKAHKIENGNFVVAVYRPFFKQFLYFSRALNEVVCQIPKLFPTPYIRKLGNLCFWTRWKRGFTALIADCIPDLHFNGDTQCFPLYYYEKQDKQKPTLWDAA